MEKEMTDWADGTEMRNYGIRCAVDVHMVSEFVRTIVALILVAGALLFYSWIRIQIVNKGYESQSLFSLEKSLLKDQAKLILEEEKLSSPERIDDIARNDLAMVPLRPNQLLLPRSGDLERNTRNAIAMADSEAALLQEGAADSYAGDYTVNSEAY
jgi:cell division protein FtsL